MISHSILCCFAFFTDHCLQVGVSGTINCLCYSTDPVCIALIYATAITNSSSHTYFAISTVFGH